MNGTKSVMDFCKAMNVFVPKSPALAIVADGTMPCRTGGRVGGFGLAGIAGIGRTETRALAANPIRRSLS